MMGLGSNAQSASNAIETISRVGQDIELVKRFTSAIDAAGDRIIRHARALGYFQPTPETKPTAPAPVITTLSDAFGALDHAIDRCSGSLNVFD